MKKIIYIMGAGRSGTTLLDTILGNNPGIFSAGELNRFPKYYGRPMLVQEQSPTAFFWNEFKSKLPADWQSGNFQEIQNLCHSFEYHSNIYKMWFPFYNKRLKKYKAYLNTFFDVLKSMVGEASIVDSSKYPMRGYYLSRLVDAEVVFIYIKRNPLDVVRSFAKKGIEQPSQGWFPANIYMYIVNVLSMNIINKLNKKHKTIAIKYEDLVFNPVKTLETISERLDIDLKNSIDLIKKGQPFKKGMLFDGNRMRLENEIFLKVNNKTTEAEGIKDSITLFLQSIWWSNTKVKY